MEKIDLILLGILFIYALVVLVPGLVFLSGRRINIAENDLPAVSVVIAARNEEKNIADVIQSLLKQNYPPGKFGVIIVDDHSDDNTRAIIENLSAKYHNLKWIQLQDGKAGKKSAIAEGILHASNEIILLTDADCKVGENWIRAMVAPFSSENVVLTSGPVVYERKQRFSIFQNEQIGLQMMSAGMMMMRTPVLLSGANYGCRKKLFGKNNAPLADEFVSGDDLAMLEKARKEGEVIFVKNREAMVETHAPKGIWNKILQRARWISKTGGIGNSAMRFTGIVVFLANLAVPFLVAEMLMEKELFSIGGIALFSKISVDVLLLSLSVPFYREPAVLLTLPVSEIVYPFI
ncbi:MAG TPA: glycosyltransferase, partial [Bacteroidia bacterium]|nr:glycosyltransferase [Bacteroidia bacterium]